MRCFSAVPEYDLAIIGGGPGGKLKIQINLTVFVKDMWLLSKLDKRV